MGSGGQRGVVHVSGNMKGNDCLSRITSGAEAAGDAERESRLRDGLIDKWID